MALEEVLGDVAGDGLGAGVEHVQVARALLGGDFVADMQQLAQAGIELRAFGIVPQGGLELGGGPAGDLILAGKPRRVHVNDGGVRSA